MQQTTGRAALVNNVLPTAKTVTAATNTTPIVVTTSVAHHLQVNEVIVIVDVQGNAAANGIFIAHAITSDTVTLYDYPGGSPVAGTGAWTSGGSLQSAGFNRTVPVPVDLNDAMRAGVINIGYEACLDRLAFLLYAIRYGNLYRNGGSSTAEAGHEFGGEWDFDAGAVINLAPGAQGTGTWTFPTSSIVKLLGQTMHRAVVVVTDSNQTVAVATANEFKLAVPSSTSRTLTIKSTSPAPVAGDWMILSLPAAGTSPTDKWIVEREDHTEIAQIRGWNVASGVADMPCAMKIEYTGSVWSGVWATFGVVPGAGF